MATYEDFRNINKYIAPCRNYYANLQPNFFYSEGIKKVADTFNCYWVINTIESFSDVVREYRDKYIDTDQLISDVFDAAVISKNNAATVSIAAIGYNDEEMEETQTIIAEQQFSYTDLPEGEYRLFLNCRPDEKLVLFLLREA